MNARSSNTLNEIELYFSSGTVGQEPVEFWRIAQNQIAYPHLFALYRKIGVYQVVNSGTERTFAGASLKVTKKQCRQLDTKLQKLVYVKANFKYFDQSISRLKPELLLEVNSPEPTEQPMDES